MILSIVEAIRRASPQGGFVRQDPNSKAWYLVGDSAAREKVGATLRSIIKAGGGEKTMLAQLVRQEQPNRPAAASHGDPLFDWIPPSIADPGVHSLSAQGSSSDAFAAQPGTSEPDISLWKSTGLETEQDDFNWFLEKESEMPPVKSQDKTDGDVAASSYNNRSSSDEVDKKLRNPSSTEQESD